MSIRWNSNLNIRLRDILLSLFNGKALNIDSIAKEMGLELMSCEDKAFFRGKMRSLRMYDENLKCLAYIKGKYLIVTDYQDMECLNIRYDNTSRAYKKKANEWLALSQATKHMQNENKYKQLYLDIDLRKEGSSS